MKFATYIQDKESNSRFGFKKDNYIIDISSAAQWANKTKNNSRFLEIPASLKEALGSWDINFSKLQQLDAFLEENNFDPKSNNGKLISVLESEVQLLSPIPNPQSFRDFYAFEQHVRSARKLRGLDMHPDWFKIAIFYFSNPSKLNLIIEGNFLDGASKYYYIILILWNKFFGYFPESIRMFSNFFGILSMLIFLRLSREFKLNNEYLILSLSLFVTNFFVIYYSEEARWYSLSLFLSTLNIYFYIKKEVSSETPW